MRYSVNSAQENKGIEYYQNKHCAEISFVIKWENTKNSTADIQ